MSTFCRIILLSVANRFGVGCRQMKTSPKTSSAGECGNLLRSCGMPPMGCHMGPSSLPCPHGSSCANAWRIMGLTLALSAGGVFVCCWSLPQLGASYHYHLSVAQVCFMLSHPKRWWPCVLFLDQGPGCQSFSQEVLRQHCGLFCFFGRVSLPGEAPLLFWILPTTQGGEMQKAIERCEMCLRSAR